MGFRLDRTYALRFEGVLDGLEVDIRSTPAGVALEIRELAMNDTGRMAELLAEYTTRWSMEDADGKPVRLERDAILAEVETPVLLELMKEWYRAATGISAPLDIGSTSGSPFLEESIPMETP